MSSMCTTRAMNIDFYSNISITNRTDKIVVVFKIVQQMMFNLKMFPRPDSDFFNVSVYIENYSGDH